MGLILLTVAETVVHDSMKDFGEKYLSIICGSLRGLLVFWDCD